MLTPSVFRDSRIPWVDGIAVNICYLTAIAQGTEPSSIGAGGRAASAARR